MQIRFTLTRLDLFRARLALVCANRALLALWAVVAIVVAYSAFTDKTTMGRGPGFRATLAILQVIFTLGFSFLALAAFTLIQTFTGKARGVIGEHTLRITDEGLEEATEYNVSLHRWTAFEKCRQRGGMLFIYVTDSMAHVVPLRRPLLEGDLGDFRRLLEEKIQP